MKYSRLPLLLVVLGCLTSLVQAHQNGELTPIKRDNKWGYANKKGKVVIPPAYDRALPFKEGLAKVGIRDPKIDQDLEDFSFLWGMIDTTGRVVVNLEYNYVRDFYEGFAAVAKIKEAVGSRRRILSDANLQWGYVDRTGTLAIPLQYYRAGDFSEGLAAISVGDDASGLCPREGKFGYVDKTGVVVIKPEYVTALQFRGGKARVGVGIIEYVGRCLCCNPEFRGQWGYVDKTGKFTSDSTSGAQ